MKKNSQEEAYNNISVLFNEILQREKAIFYIKKGVLASKLIVSDRS